METISLKNKVAIVTGASKGIGKAIAIALAKEKAIVILAARNSELLADVKNTIIANSGTVESIPTDVTSENSV